MQAKGFIVQTPTGGHKQATANYVQKRQIIRQPMTTKNCQAQLIRHQPVQSLQNPLMDATGKVMRTTIGQPQMLLQNTPQYHHAKVSSKSILGSFSTLRSFSTRQSIVRMTTPLNAQSGDSDQYKKMLQAYNQNSLQKLGFKTEKELQELRNDLIQKISEEYNQAKNDSTIWKQSDWVTQEDAMAAKSYISYLEWLFRYQNKIEPQMRKKSNGGASKGDAVDRVINFEQNQKAQEDISKKQIFEEAFGLNRQIDQKIINKLDLGQREKLKSLIYKLNDLSQRKKRTLTQQFQMHKLAAGIVEILGQAVRSKTSTTIQKIDFPVDLFEPLNSFLKYLEKNNLPQYQALSYAQIQNWIKDDHEASGTILAKTNQDRENTLEKELEMVANIVYSNCYTKTQLKYDLALIQVKTAQKLREMKIVHRTDFTFEMQEKFYEQFLSQAFSEEIADLKAILQSQKYYLPDTENEEDEELQKLKLEQIMENLRFRMSQTKDKTSDKYKKLQDELMFAINKLIQYSENKLEKIDQDKSSEVERLKNLKELKQSAMGGDDLDKMWQKFAKTTPFEVRQMRFIFQGLEYDDLSFGASLLIMSILGASWSNNKHTVITVDDFELSEEKIQEIETIVQNDKQISQE